MRLYEFEAKKLFEHQRIPIPKQIGLLRSIDDLLKLNLEKLEFPLIFKSMVLIGGRGKSGGIKKAENFEEAVNITTDLFKLKIKGYPVKLILVEEVIDVRDEIYLAIATDPINFDVTIIASASGGVEIEEVAKSTPDKIITKKISDNAISLSESILSEISTFLILKNPYLSEVKIQLDSCIRQLYNSFQIYDGRIFEINPLVTTTQDQNVIAADAKIVLDDNALYRQSTLLNKLNIDPSSKRHDVAEQTSFEARAYKMGIIGYVDLLPNPDKFQKDPKKLYIGLIPGGAGYGIFSIDEVKNIGDRYFNGMVVPINFMDSGGGPSSQQVAEMFHILMDHPIPDLIITSRFGGISSCDIFIQGLILALRDRYTSGKRLIPVYGRMVGTDLPEARIFLEKAKENTPEPLKDLTIVIGNQKIMADVIRDGIKYGFSERSH